MTEKLTEKLADIVDDAADLIERNGLAREVYVDGDDRYCTLGALAAAVNPRWQSWAGTSPVGTLRGAQRKVYDAAADAVQARLRAAGVQQTHIPYWSDQAPVQEVLDILRATAKGLRP